MKDENALKKKHTRNGNWLLAFNLISQFTVYICSQL